MRWIAAQLPGTCERKKEGRLRDPLCIVFSLKSIQRQAAVASATVASKRLVGD
jgi:hypothetical protein